MKPCCMLCVLLVILVCGCNKIDNVKIYPASDNVIALIEETSYGQGAATSDYTRVSAYDIKRKVVMREVLAGENLDIKYIKWHNTKSVDICLEGGITSSYHNLIPVSVDKKLFLIKTELLSQKC